VWLRENRGAADRGSPSKLGRLALTEMNLAACHLHRRKKVSVGQRIVAFGRATDTHVVFNEVIKGSHVAVRDRPILPMPVVAGRLEILIAQAIALVPPAKSPAAYK